VRVTALDDLTLVVEPTPAASDQAASTNAGLSMLMLAGSKAAAL
jgi:hypothetical protein